MSILIEGMTMQESGTTITGTIEIPNTVTTAVSHYPTWTVGIASAVPELFICPYCDTISKEPGICDRCGGTKVVYR